MARLDWSVDLVNHDMKAITLYLCFPDHQLGSKVMKNQDRQHRGTWQSGLKQQANGGSNLVKSQ